MVFADADDAGVLRVAREPVRRASSALYAELDDDYQSRCGAWILRGASARCSVPMGRVVFGAFLVGCADCEHFGDSSVSQRFAAETVDGIRAVVFSGCYRVAGTHRCFGYDGYAEDACSQSPVSMGIWPYVCHYCVECVHVVHGQFADVSISGGAIWAACDFGCAGLSEYCHHICVAHVLSGVFYQVGGALQSVVFPCGSDLCGGAVQSLWSGFGRERSVEFEPSGDWLDDIWGDGRFCRVGVLDCTVSFSRCFSQGVFAR